MYMETKGIILKLDMVARRYRKNLRISGTSGLALTYGSMVQERIRTAVAVELLQICFRLCLAWSASSPAKFSRKAACSSWPARFLSPLASSAIPR
jgi:hypothetical protein